MDLKIKILYGKKKIQFNMLYNNSIYCLIVVLLYESLITIKMTNTLKILNLNSQLLHKMTN